MVTQDPPSVDDVDYQFYAGPNCMPVTGLFLPGFKVYNETATQIGEDDTVLFDVSQQLDRELGGRCLNFSVASNMVMEWCHKKHVRSWRKPSPADIADTSPWTSTPWTKETIQWSRLEGDALLEDAKAADLFTHATVTHEFTPMEPELATPRFRGAFRRTPAPACRINVTLVFECALDENNDESPTFVIQTADQRSSYTCLEAIPYIAVVKTRAACPPAWSERMQDTSVRNKILEPFFHHVLNQTNVRIHELDAEQDKLRLASLLLHSLMYPHDSSLPGFQLEAVIYGEPRVALFHWDPRQWKEGELVQVFLDVVATSKWAELYTLLLTAHANTAQVQTNRPEPLLFGLGGETTAEHCLLQHYQRGTLLTEGCAAAMAEEISTATALLGVERVLETEGRRVSAGGSNPFDEHTLPDCSYSLSLFEDPKDLEQFLLFGD
jgi:hypothetical protein